MTQKELDILTNIIGAVETGGQIYGKRRYECYVPPYHNSDKEHTCTLGWAGNYGSRARKLCQMIFDENSAEFRKADTANIESKLKVDWVATKWNPTASQKNALISIITTPTGKKCQDKLFQESAKSYIKNAEFFGITDIKAQMLWAEIEHLGGRKSAERIFNRAEKPYTSESIFASLLLDQKDTSNNNQVGDKKFQSRHECCVKWVNQYVNMEGSDTQMGTLNGLLKRAEAELGYIEKASNSNLDSKTGNKGTSNYTKYARDINALGLAGCQGQPWCITFQFWLEVQEFGLEKALEHWHMNKKTYVGYNCFSTYNTFPSSKRSKTPKLGAVVIFTQSHAGRVVSINGNTFTTIEGNTSPAAYDRNGGMVAKKTYNVNDSKIKGFLLIDYDTSLSSSTTQSSSVSDDTTLQRGSSGSAVKTMQIMLIACGYSCGNAGADGDFGDGTFNALKAFQKDASLVVDGIYGSASKTALQAKYKAVMASQTSNTEGNVAKGQRWLNTNYGKIIKASTGKLLTVDNSYGTHSRNAALAVWKDVVNRKYGKKLTPSNTNFGTSCIASSPSLTLNSEGTLVYILQFILSAKGFYTGTMNARYTTEVKSAVIAYRKSVGLTQDSICDGKTWNKLFN